MRVYWSGFAYQARDEKQLSNCFLYLRQLFLYPEYYIEGNILFGKDVTK